MCEMSILHFLYIAVPNNYVAVLGINRTLFHCIFHPLYWWAHACYVDLRHSCILAAHMSHALNRSFVLYTSLNTTIHYATDIMLGFYTSVLLFIIVLPTYISLNFCLHLFTPFSPSLFLFRWRLT